VKNHHHKRVVITGAGVVSALGDSWSEVKGSLLAKKNAVCFMEDWQKFGDMKTRLAAPIIGFSLPPNYSKKKTRSMGRVAQMAVVATERALADAGISDKALLASGEVGVAYGSATGSTEGAWDFFHLLHSHSTAKINSTTYLRMMSHTAAVNISVYFGTQGRMYTTSSACTAGSQALGYAYETIRQGQQQVMIAGGAEELCPTQAAVFDTIFAASTRNDQPQLTPRPFDRQRDGLVLGEGACTLIVESLKHATERGATVLAEVVGFATNTDGSHLVRPRQATMEKVMSLSLQDAQLSADAIGYVSAHATGTDQGDIAESLATNNILGVKPVSSLKSYTGHSLGACASFEAWAGIQMMREGWFAPTINLDEIEPACAPLDYITEECRQITTDYIMSNNFAFGGVNTSLIFKRLD